MKEGLIAALAVGLLGLAEGAWLPAKIRSATAQASAPTTATFPILHFGALTAWGYEGNDPGDGMFVGPFEEEGAQNEDRSYVMFDTSSLGAGVTVTSARLDLKLSGRDYLANGQTVQVRESTWSYPINTGQWNAFSTVAGSVTFFAGDPIGTVKSATLATGSINKTGVTRYALVGSTWASMNEDPAFSRAGSYLSVTYTAP